MQIVTGKLGGIIHCEVMLRGPLKRRVTQPGLRCGRASNVGLNT
jgi:hypothetical protein